MIEVQAVLKVNQQISSTGHREGLASSVHSSASPVDWVEVSEGLSVSFLE